MEPEPEVSERRRHSRWVSQLPVRVSTIDADVDPRSGRRYFRSFREWSSNLSRGGVFVKTRESLDPGSRLLIEVSLPSGETLEAVGRVAWTRHGCGGAAAADELGQGVGVKFIGATAEQMVALERYLYGDSEAGE